MKQEDPKILIGLGKDPGFKVPENYFEEFNKRMLDSLPEKEITEVEKPQEQKATVVDKPSMWVRVRPYLYMAAAFAGIFGMVKVFNMYNGTDISELARGMDDEKNAEELIMSGTSEYDILNYEDSVMMDAAGEELKSVTK
ncbi:MAG: hypothetical protein KBT13_03535 [Bacteroidales bacterium]|nr:hypothetical protein [Candidatus Sodaliphilus limicaballi]